MRIYYANKRLFENYCKTHCVVRICYKKLTIFDFGAIVKVTYSHKIGPGKFFCGISADINFIQQKYKISGYDVNIGNVLTVAPVIGYTFILKEDKGVAKITEKNKRIKDIDVE